ncbi:hypothetical protein ASE35_20260 [Lysobacter sp. Root916]|nr:hypothetical protein ASE35_20260 [Lysobacter sp. Root916]
MWNMMRACRWRRMQKMKIAILSLCFAVISVSACYGGKPKELRNLEGMSLEQARTQFQTLPPDIQVRIVVWELEHRRPSSSRFDYLLDKNGTRVGPLLLAEAVQTGNLTINVTLLLEFAQLQPLSISDRDGRLSAALSRCFELGGRDNRECWELQRELAQRTRTPTVPH